MLDDLTTIFELTDDEKERMISPKYLYNEDYMLLLLMYWFSRQDNMIVNSDLDRKICRALQRLDNGRCYTHAVLETPFKIREMGIKDNLAESSTLVSGVIGDFKVLYGKKKERVVLLEGANQFIVIQTIMFKELRKGIKINKKYNQVAKTIACMIQTMARLEDEFVENAGYFVIGPKEQLKLESFKNFTYKPYIEEMIKDRLKQYGENEDTNNFKEIFQRIFQRIEVECISFEDIIPFIKKNDLEYGNKFELFYKKSLIYHGKK